MFEYIAIAALVFVGAAVYLGLKHNPTLAAKVGADLSAVGDAAKAEAPQLVKSIEQRAADLVAEIKAQASSVGHATTILNSISAGPPDAPPKP